MVETETKTKTETQTRKILSYLISLTTNDEEKGKFLFHTLHW